LLRNYRGGGITQEQIDDVKEILNSEKTFFSINWSITNFKNNLSTLPQNKDNNNMIIKMLSQLDIIKGEYEKIADILKNALKK
jgi:hypothetical protein